MRNTGFSRRLLLAGLGSTVLAGPVSAQPKRANVVFEAQTTVLFDGDELQAKILEYRNGEGCTFFAPHNDETAALYAGEEVISKHGGRLLQLVHGGRRNIEFTFKDKPYMFDPNRMFTDRGIRATLQRLGSKNYSKEAHALVKGFAQVVVEELNLSKLHKGVLIGLHNNTPGRYSINSYVKGGSEEKEASLVHVNPKLGEDDFFFVNASELFQRLKALNYNVVLQNNAGMTDDGSLSVYSTHKKIPYANVEAQHGRSALQIKMIQALLGVI